MNMIVLVAPDGGIQYNTLSTDIIFLYAWMRMMADTGIVEPLPLLIERGFKIHVVDVSFKTVEIL